eukprot:TRINITY_DN11463_c0_g2_i6.p1 TRINITY_DN11463_c0_g2~~TRINITY_DN11463_c0_g2_i6.p1  ORF type:complete len:286 (-),score=40.17 TRINITY_DN11463_c0_g2_i6:79-936(-)
MCIRDRNNILLTYADETDAENLRQLIEKRQGLATAELFGEFLKFSARVIDIAVHRYSNQVALISLLVRDIRERRDPLLEKVLSASPWFDRSPIPLRSPPVLRTPVIADPHVSPVRNVVHNPKAPVLTEPGHEPRRLLSPSSSRREFQLKDIIKYRQRFNELLLGTNILKEKLKQHSQALILDSPSLDLTRSAKGNIMSSLAFLRPMSGMTRPNTSSTFLGRRLRQELSPQHLRTSPTIVERRASVGILKKGVDIRRKGILARPGTSVSTNLGRHSTPSRFSLQKS